MDVRRGALITILGGCLCATGLQSIATPPVAVASIADDDIGQYPLDDIARVLDPGEELPCKRARLVDYRGELIRYHRTTKVHADFVPRLRAFERVVVQTAKEIYGRAPRRLKHMGTYACRRIRRYPDWVSEHALGNAIDVAGFDFGRLPRGEALPAGLPRSLRRSFSVRVEDHWNGKRRAAAVHRRFLRTLARRLIARPEIFRTLLGPAYPGHRNHFHFDCAPYRVVDIFEAGE